MICNECGNKSKPIALAGTCKKCQGQTSCFSYKLCDDCSDEINACEWCERGIDDNGDPVKSNSATSVIPDGSYIIALADKQNGTSVKGLRSGEYVTVTLKEDQYSNKEWDLKPGHDKKVVLYAHRGEFEPDADDMQFGTRTFVFKVSGSGNTTISFHEVNRIWSWFGHTNGQVATPVVNGQTFSANLEVK